MKNAKIEKFYSVYRIILKEKEKGVNEDNIKDLTNIGICDTLQDVAELLNYNNTYIKSIKTIKNKYKLIDNKYIVYIDTTEDVIL